MKKWLYSTLVILLFATGCSSTLRKRDNYIFNYQIGNLQGAEKEISDIICKEMPDEDYRSSKDAVWLLLDRATTRFVNNEIDEAIADYQLALESLDFYNQQKLQELLGQIILQDEIGAYAGDDFEQILARIYFALALFHQGDHSNAIALLRQAEAEQQLKRNYFAKNPYLSEQNIIDNALGKFLFATALQRRGDLSNAKILYYEIEWLVGQEALNHVLMTEDPSLAFTETATLIFVCHNGNVPFKISEVSEASQASTMALEFFLAGTEITPPALSSLPGIPTPALADWTDSFPFSTYLKVDQHPISLVPWYHVAEVADQELAQKMPTIVARGIARYLIRRSIVGSVAKHNEDAAIFADFAMFVANLATKADTRSWRSLPYRIDLARLDLVPGKHQIQTANGPCTLDLQKGDLCIINIFNLHPGMTRVLIPERYKMRPLIEGEKS